MPRERLELLMSMRSVINITPHRLVFHILVGSWLPPSDPQEKLFLSFSLTRQELPAERNAPDSISLGVTQLCAHISTSMHLRSARKVL